MSRSELQPEPAKSPARQKARHVSQHLPALFLAVLCGLVFFETATTLTEQGYASGTPISNAALYPRLLAGLLLFLLSLQVLSDVRAKGPSVTAEAPSAPGQARQTAYVALGIIAYIALLPALGFLVATPIFVMALMLMLGDRNLTTLIGVPLGITVGCMAVFQGLFNVNLPRGVLGIALNF